MAEIQYTFTNHRKGLKCTGKKRLECGHTVTEWAYCNREDAGKQAVETLMDSQVERHKDKCKK